MAWGHFSLLIAKPSVAEKPLSLSDVWGTPALISWLTAKGSSIAVLSPAPLLSTQGLSVLSGRPWA